MVIHKNVHADFSKYILFINAGYLTFDNAVIGDDQVILQRNGLTSAVLTENRNEFFDLWREINE